MTGMFMIYENGKHIKDVELIPQEILEDLYKWFIQADRDDEFRIRCELPS